VTLTALKQTLGAAYPGLNVVERYCNKLKQWRSCHTNHQVCRQLPSRHQPRRTPVDQNRPTQHALGEDDGPLPVKQHAVFSEPVNRLAEGATLHVAPDDNQLAG
jgi:hypothetical protein